MTPISRRALVPAKLVHRPVVSAISLIVLLTMLGAVLFIVLRSPLKDDIAWLLYVARRWLGGRELYVDVVEVNPPLIVWISAVPLEVAGWLHTDPRFVAMPVFVAAVLGCAWWAASLLRPPGVARPPGVPSPPGVGSRQGGLFTERLPVFAVIGSALLVLPGADLGQREHLLVAAFLPYLALFARTLDAKRSLDDSAPPIVTWLAAGVLAGLGCALKPRYAAVFVALECLALWRGMRPWRVMPVAAAATLVGYAGLVAIVCPAYFRLAVPMALALYGATDVPFLKLLSDSAMLMSGQVVAIGLLWLRRRSLANYNLMLTLVVFAVTSTVVCFIEGKDWFYHRLPATIATVLALLLWLATEIIQRRWRIRWPLLVGGFAVAAFCVSSIQRLRPGVAEAIEPRRTVVDHLVQIIRAEHARTYVAFTEWIALGFPVVNETGVRWASRFDSMWALKGEVWLASFDPATARAWPIARWVAHDFIAGCPDLTVVDTRETTDYIRVLSLADPAFARVWSRYRRIAAFDGLVVYRRGRAGCLDVRVAAQPKSATAIR